MNFAAGAFGYASLVENRVAEGHFFNGPCAAWFRMNHPLVQGETPSPYQRVAVAADSGNGISAALDFSKYLFINCDLTINLFRRPEGEWVCLDSRSLFGDNGCGLAEFALYDERGMIGRATQSLTVRPRWLRGSRSALSDDKAEMLLHGHKSRIVVQHEAAHERMTLLRNVTHISNRRCSRRGTTSLEESHEPRSGMIPRSMRAA